MFYKYLTTRYLFIFLGIMIIGTTSCTFLNINITSKNNHSDKALHKFMSFYDNSLKDAKDLPKYHKLFIEGYGTLVDHYVVALSEDKLKKMLDSTQAEVSKELEKLSKNKKPIVSAEYITQYALTSLYSQLDPHTAWLDKQESEDLKTNIDGEYKGLGIVLAVYAKNKKYVQIVSVIKDGPAYRAGLKKNDLIYKVDGKSYVGKDFVTVSKVLRGKDESKVKVEVLRNKHLLAFVIKRGAVHLQTVEFMDLNHNKYAYIKITGFYNHTAQELRNIINKYHVNAFKGIILDLRYNPGGLLFSSLIASDAFIPKGLLLFVKGRDKANNKFYYATKKTLINSKIPVVILVNNMTASAAEIMSGALQQNNRAIVMGQPSFGKGSVQTVYPIGDDGMAKVTIQLFYTPNGHSLQGTGIIPDVLIENKVKNSFADFREDLYKNAITVEQQPVSKKTPQTKIKDTACKPYVLKDGDLEIGCAIMYLDGKIKLKKTG